MRPHRPRHLPLATPRGAALLVLGAIGAIGALAACSDGPLSGPGLAGPRASLRLEPRVEPRASVVAAGIARVRVAITRVPDGLVVLDSVVQLVGSAGAELDLEVPLASSSDRFAVRLAAADAAGDTIFRAGDTTEVVRGPAAPTLEVMLRYAGPDTGVARIAVGPDSSVAGAGESVGLWAVGYRPGTSEATPLAHVSWRSGDETVVQVSRTGGQATAVAPGRAAWVYATTITGLVDSARVVVRSVVASLEASPASVALVTDAAQRVAVQGRAADGSALVANAVTWTSSDPAVATVGDDGTVTAVGVGAATVTATSGAAQVVVPVVVQRPPVAAVAVAPTSVSLVRLQRAQLSATATIAGGAPATGRPVTWTTSDAGVATVDANGIASAVGVGSATVTATVGGVAASTAISVAPLPSDAIVASPSTVQLMAGESLALSATVTDAAGDLLTSTPVTWQSASAAVALVSVAGQLTAVAPGTTTVTASANGRTSTVAVTVTPIPVSAVVLSSGKFPLVAGAVYDLDAMPTSASGAPLPDRAVTWSSKTPSVATVDANGVVTALAPGFTMITATSEGVEGSVKVDVLPVPVARVELSATAVSLLAGATYQLRADAYDSLGRLVTGRPVSWSSDAPSVAKVASDGLVQAQNAGTTLVTAAIGGKSATGTVTVTAAPSPSGTVVQFSPAGARYAVGQTMPVQQVGLSADHGTTVLQLGSWDGGIASVQQEVTVTGTTPAPFTVTGLALGTVRLQATSSVATMAVSDVEIVAGTLRADGWAGATIVSNGYRRIRIYPGGVDGTATGAVFAGGIPLTVTYDDRHLEVHLDAAPSKPVGDALDSDRAGSISVGDTVTPAAGQPYVSLLIRGKNLGLASLSLAGPVGSLAPLDLTGLPIL